jgi:hypothetical protein
MLVNMATPGIFQLHQLKIVADDEQQRHDAMDRAWGEYYGFQKDVLATKPGQADDNVKVNKCRVIVDKGASFLFGGDIAFTCDEDCPEGAQDWLDACWKANKQGSLLHDAAIAGGVTGHVFIQIALPEPGSDFPELTVLDPEMVSVTWDPKNIKKVLRFTIAWNSVDPETHKVVNYRQLIEKQTGSWRITDQETQPDSTTWLTTNTAVWPYAWPPMAECKNLPAPNAFWGISDIEADVQGLNRACSLVLSNMQRIIRFHAHPHTVASGVGGADITVDVDGVIVLPSADGKMYNLEMQSDLASSINLFEKIEQSVHEVSRVPAISTGTLDKLGPLSGVALKVLYQPLIEKTDSKRTLYGEMLQELCAHLLELGGTPGCSCTVTWPEMLPVDPLQELQALLLMDQLGIVSKQTMSDRSHLDYETEQQQIEDEAKEAAAAMPAQPAVPGEAVANPAQTLPPPPMTGAPMERGMRPQGGG